MKHRIALALLALAWAGPAAAMELSSPDIHDGGEIALEHVYPRCGGANVSPAFRWSGVPAGTKSLALSMIDVDVKPAMWSHWLVVDLPPNTAGLPKGASQLPVGAKPLMTDFGDAAYGGPCPPKGSGVHHYQFTLWALPYDTIAFPRGATTAEISAALSKISLAKATLTGTYQR